MYQLYSVHMALFVFVLNEDIVVNLREAYSDGIHKCA